MRRTSTIAYYYNKIIRRTKASEKDIDILGGSDSVHFSAKKNRCQLY